MQKGSLKKIVCMLLCFVLLMTSGVAVLLFSACGGKKVDYDPDNFIDVDDPLYDTGKIVKEKITIRMFTPKNSAQPKWEDMVLFKWMEEKTNIHVEFESVLLESYQEKRGLKWEEKDPSKMADAFYLCNNPDEVTALVASNAITRLNDPEGSDAYSGNYGNLIENYMPNYKALMEEHSGIADETTQLDGGIYSLCSVNTSNTGGFAKQYINKTWLEKTDWYKQNQKVPETIEELEIVLTEFRDKDMNGNGDPYDEIPLSYYTADQTRNFIMSAFGFVGTGIEMDTREKILQDGQWVDNPTYGQIVWVPATDAYREYTKLMRRWYEEGLIDENIYANDAGKLAAKGFADQLGCFSTAGAWLVVGEDLDDDYTSIGPLTSSVNQTKMWYQFSGQYNSTLLIIPQTSPYKREIARWMDVLYDPATIPMQYVGIEGENWQWNDRADGTPGDGSLETDTWHFNIPEGMQREQYRAQLSPSAYTDGAVLTSDFTNREDDPKVLKVAEESQIYLPYLKRYIPTLVYTGDQMEVISSIEGSLNTIMSTSEAYFITDVNNSKNEYDPENDEHWQKFLDKMANAGNISAKGYAMLVEQYQAALDTYNQMH